MKTFVMTALIPMHVVRSNLLREKATQNQCEVLVSSSTKKGAIAAFNAAGIECTPYKLGQYGEEVTDHPVYSVVAVSDLDRVFIRRLGTDDPWVRLPDRPREEVVPMKHPAREGRRTRYEAFRDSLIDEIQGYPV